MPSFSTLANVIDASGEIYASKVVLHYYYYYYYFALAWCLAHPALIAALLGCVAARSFGARNVSHAALNPIICIRTGRPSAC